MKKWPFCAKHPTQTSEEFSGGAIRVNQTSRRGFPTDRSLDVSKDLDKKTEHNGVLSRVGRNRRRYYVGEGEEWYFSCQGEFDFFIQSWNTTCTRGFYTHYH